MLEAKAVNFAYTRGEPVIHDINLTIKDGEFVALLGHNGSGKTTLSRLFMALCHPRSGIIALDGDDIANQEPADLADKIGYVFQNPDLQILEDTVFDEIAYGPRIRKTAEPDVIRHVEAAMEATGLTELRNAYPRLLSFGQKRRLGVAAALALNPKTLILDEITNGQDSLEQERIMHYLQNINERGGITIILITHDMEIAARYAKRTIVLKRGKVAFDGSPAQLFDGTKPLESWGLYRPTVLTLAGALNVKAMDANELVDKIERKSGDRI